MLRAMTVEVTAKIVESTPTAVVAAAATWAEFPKIWGPMLDKVWSFLRGDAPEGLYKHQAVCEWSEANGYRLAGPRWVIHGNPDPSTCDFDVDLLWSLSAP